jgi:methyltransferase (TIGR00027 family)
MSGKREKALADEPAKPEITAVWVALWRALHVHADPEPHVFNDTVGLALVAPEPGWRSRPDMQLEAMSRIRASIVGRARAIEDHVVEQSGRGIGQYVILGAGLDSFAQRRPNVAARMKVFEIDQPQPQAWKRKRLIELGLGIPDWLRLVPVDFEGGDSWWDRLLEAGFDPDQPAVVASAGVSMYLTREANAATLRQVAVLAPGSTLIMTFNLPIELVEPAERRLRRIMANQASRYISFFTPDEMLALAREAGLRKVAHVSAANLADLYFSGRTDGLRPSSIEHLMVARI